MASFDRAQSIYGYTAYPRRLTQRHSPLFAQLPQALTDVHIRSIVLPDLIIGWHSPNSSRLS